MIPKNEIITFLKNTELFKLLSHSVLNKLAKEFEPVYLHSGQQLLKQGDAGDFLYIVFNGRLRASSHANDSEPDALLSEMGRGELIGELAWLTKSPRAATVIAIRDSILLKLSHKSFERFVEKNPIQLMPIVRSALLRIMDGKKRVRNTIVTIAVAPAGNSVAHSKFSQFIANELEKSAPILYLNSKKIHEIFPALTTDSCDERNIELTNWLNHQEFEYRYIVYETDINFTPWTRRCLRQADQILLVANDNDRRSVNEMEKFLFSQKEEVKKLVDLVLVHHEKLLFPDNTREWLEKRPVNQYHHMRENVKRDAQRIMRYLTGTSVGLVLGGGGARGFAHIGVWKALKELGIEVDFIGGASFGALLAGMFAMEQTPDQVMQIFRELMLADKKFFSLTAPVVSLNTGKPLTNVMKIAFAQPRYIEDLWKRFFCIVCNLSRGEMEVRQSGLAWRAMRATVSLPGIFPPITNEKKELLIDGGVSNNLPVDIMRKIVNGGRVIASHVQTATNLEAEIPDGVLSGWGLLANKFFHRKQRPYYPNIAELISRSIGLTNTSKEISMMNESDYFIDIDARHFKLLDFHSMDKLVELGYQVTMDKMTKKRFV